MGAETVIRKIEEKVASECEAIIASAENKSKAITEKIIKNASAKADSIISNAEQKVSTGLKSVEQQVRLENRIGRLNQKQSIINDLKNDLLKTLSEYSDKEKIAINTKLVINSGMNGEITALVPDKDKHIYSDGTVFNAWGKGLSDLTGKKTEIKLSEDTVDIFGGLYLQSALYDIDLSYEAYVEELFEENRKAIADRLFNEGDNS